MAEMSQTEAGAEVLSQANPNPEEKQPIYEVGFHLVPGLGEDGAASTAATIRAGLGDAEIISEQAPQKMTLAYTIERSVQGKREKFTESYFGWIKFAAPRADALALQEKLRLMPEVLRYLLIETVREDVVATPRRAIFTSTRLEGETIKKPTAIKEEKVGEVSEEELDKSLDALIV
jgi:ribosomal protein S6